MSFQKHISEKNAKSAVRLLLGGIFIFSAITKIIDSSGLTAQLKSLNLWTETGIDIITYALIIFELVLGLWLIIRNNRMPVLLTLGTLLVFCCFLAYKVYINDLSSCGCFGTYILRSTHQELGNNLLLLLGTVYIL